MNRSIVIDYHKCVGCRNCEMICSLTHEGVCSPAFSRIRVVTRERAGWSVPVGCLGCEEPNCVAACPRGASCLDSSTGLVTIAASKCIGCRQCVLACPSGHINYDESKGSAYKCDLCGGQPQCAKYCWTGAITFELIEDTTRDGMPGSPI